MWAVDVAGCDLYALIRLLRQSKLVAAEIAQRLPLARSTISAVLTRIGLNRVRYLTPPEPARRYEWERPGELVHVDIKRRISGKIEPLGMQ